MLNGVVVALLSGQTRQITALVRRLTIDPLLARNCSAREVEFG